MKTRLIRAERFIFSHHPFRWIVLAIDFGIRKTLWVWGRIRFAALVNRIGEGGVCHWNSEIKYPQKLVLGHRVVIGANASIGAHAGITLKDDVRLSRDVILETAGLDFNQMLPYPHISSPIILEEGVWVGARAVILGGVVIGRQSVIAAGSVVTKSFPPFSLIGGVPARLIRLLQDS